MKIIVINIVILFMVSSCFSEKFDKQEKENVSMGNGKNEQVIFGAGCFWCVEAIFEEVEGVVDVSSGYAGGLMENPTYEQVCSGETGHAEVCLIKYDPDVVSFTELLEIFWGTHDPTTLNRQGMDRGTQYRSVIFYYSEEQRQLAEKYKAKLDESGIYQSPIVTEISPAGIFYPAEKYHQDYFRNNPEQAYCQFTIVPKLEKFRKIFREKLRDSR